MSRRFALGFGLALVSLVALAACRSEGETQQRPGAVPAPVKTAKVREGAISATASFSGSIQAKDQVELMAGTSGRIERITVDLGSVISRGETIAQLETDTLQVALKQAEANLQSAQAQLNTVLSGARPEQAAAARATLEASRIRLAGLREQQTATAQSEVARFAARLDDLRAGAKAADLAGAKAQVDTATAALARDQVRLNQLLSPTAADIQAAQAALETAKSALAAAEARRDTLDADIAAAQAGVDSAKAAVTTAETKVEDLLQPRVSALTKAQADVETARSTLEKAQATWEGMATEFTQEKRKHLTETYLDWWIAKRKLEDAQARGASAAEIEADREEVARLLAQLKAAEESANATEPGVSAQDYLGNLAALQSAKAGLASAEAKLHELKNPAATDLQTARAGADSARANLASAQAKLNSLSGPRAGEANARLASVDSARAAITSAEAKLNQLKNPTPADIETSRAAVETARANREAAQAKWDQLKAGATAAEVQAAESDLVRAQNNVLQAGSDAEAQAQQVAQLEQQAALAESPYTTNDLQRTTAGVAVAEAQVEQARLALSKATVTAPFDAIVAKKYLSEGALAGGNSPIVSLVSSSVELVFNVEEAALGQVRPGQPVSFAVPAYGERPFRGKVSTIAPIADAASRTFTVKVVPEDPQAQLKAGMFANLQAIVSAKEKTLLVPRAASVQRPDGTAVFVVKDGKAELRKVRLGLTSDSDVEIVEGLSLGEDVVVQGNRTLRGNDDVKVVEDQPAGAGPGGQGQQRPGGQGGGRPSGQ